jgi:beta-lactamase class A
MLSPAAPLASPTPTNLAPDDAAPAAPVYDANAAITQVLSSTRGVDVSIAALNVTTGVRYDYGLTKGIREGSIVKLDIFLTALYNAHGRSLTASQKALAASAMQKSDNGDADDLFRNVGGNRGVQIANKTFGLTSTVLDSGGIWGMSTTSASDQLRLLAQLVTPGPISSAQQQYALDLMRHVESDQSWGVSAAADPKTATALKNGWLGVDIDHGRWLTNSAGVVTVHGQTVLLAVLTQHNRDYDSGVDLVEALAKAVAPAVVAG